MKKTPLVNLEILCLMLALPFAANGQQEGQKAQFRERLVTGLESLTSRNWEQNGYHTILAVIKEARDAGDLPIVAEAVARLIEVSATTETQETRSAAFLLLRRAGPRSIAMVLSTYWSRVKRKQRIGRIAQAAVATLHSLKDRARSSR